jgi:hypothetical protein
MLSRLRTWFRNPLFLLGLVAGLSAFVVQSGELGTSDTAHRLQTTHSIWTPEPEVLPQEYPEFGLHGRGGKLHSWYGMGQPLIMLPADIIGTYIGRLEIFNDYDGTDPSVRSIFVSYTTNILISILTVLVCFRFQRQLSFTVRQSAAGVLALLFCTTHLHYTQNMMENNYIMLLTMTGFSFQYEWLRTGSRRALLIGSTTLGLNLLTRLTTGLDIISAGIFLLLILWFEKAHQDWWRRFIEYAKVTVPVYGCFFLIDRVYQYARFGSFTNTYLTLFGKEWRQLDPTLPANFPWSAPFHEGFWGPLIKPEKSVFLFDPLIILSVLLVLVAWKHFRPEAKAYMISAFLMIFAYIVFYARYFVWAGDMAWGDRYVSTTVEMAAFISVPLLLRYRVELGEFVWATGIGLVAISAVVQLASLAFWLPLEIYQMETFGHPTFVVALRLKNIVAFAFGKMDQWGLNTHSMVEDDWDYVHLTTWNFLPFLLRRVGQAPAWVVKITFVIWGAGLVALGTALWRLRQILRLSENQS